MEKYADIFYYLFFLSNSTLSSILSIQVLNFRRMDERSSSGLVRVGMFSEGEGLLLNSTLVVTYDDEGHEKPMAEVRSRCLDVEACGGSGGAPTARPARRNSQYLQVRER